MKMRDITHTIISNPIIIMAIVLVFVSFFAYDRIVSNITKSVEQTKNYTMYTVYCGTQVYEYHSIIELSQKTACDKIIGIVE